MYTLKLTNGDIAVRGDGGTVPLAGKDRIEQELLLWLLEPVGTDRMYGEFGSNLENFIGSNITDDALMNIRSELIRVVGNYVAYEGKIAEEYAKSSSREMLDAWSEDDVIAALSDIWVDPAYDRVEIIVSLLTTSGLMARLNRSL